MLYLLLTLLLFVALLELPRLIKTKQRKDLIAFLITYLLCVYLGLAQLYNWPIYNPFKPGVEILARMGL